ncbi:class I SAM-dependent methyltransferase [Candidatus Micrarchaeota archaeon]|nr:class I SAM-dependent methyltransferase [Candidatus Micrarchaeota archaeon]
MGYLKRGVEGNLDKLPLAIEKESFEFVVISEVLEHLAEPEKVIKEAYRVLKKGGLVIITVPLDTTLSTWNILFETECYVLGDILGNKYYKKRCGHVQHFSVKTASEMLETQGFVNLEKKVTIMNIGISAQKK